MMSLVPIIQCNNNFHMSAGKVPVHVYHLPTSALGLHSRAWVTSSLYMNIRTHTCAQKDAVSSGWGGRQLLVESSILAWFPFAFIDVSGLVCQIHGGEDCSCGGSGLEARDESGGGICLGLIRG